ncbi:hypothetical protein A9K55_003700 [Cordyceps militaris]|nr:hypothetical protein A9K55_003700 [Cordyceps militaris]
MIMKLPSIAKVTCLFQAKKSRIIVAGNRTTQMKKWNNLVRAHMVNIEILFICASLDWGELLDGIEQGAEELFTMMSCYKPPRVVQSIVNQDHIDIWRSLCVLQVCLQDCIDLIKSNHSTIEICNKEPNFPKSSSDYLEELRLVLERAGAIKLALERDTEVVSSVPDFLPLGSDTGILCVDAY